MKLFSDRFVAFGLLLCLTAPAWSDDSVPSSEYYPLKRGSAWLYKVNDQKITVAVVKYEKIGNVLCARVETSASGTVLASEYIAVGEDGLYRHAYGGAFQLEKFKAAK
jgi:hypothetical protein